MRHASLFSGIGGFDLAAQWMGWSNEFHCEINPFCQQILKYYWPNAKTYSDIKQADFSIWRGRIDVLSGGFPCQPFSSAGKRKGTEDDRYLWPEMLRAIREIQPTWVVGENVRGLTNWNRGMVFDKVQADLEAEGYKILPFLLPACGVNAPHRRDRIWFIAYSHRNGLKLRRSVQDRSAKKDSPGQEKEWERIRADIGRISEPGTTPNCDGLGLGSQNNQDRKSKFADQTRTANHWHDFPTQPPIRGGNDGLSRKLDGITIPKHYRKSIEAYGNAVVPQLVYEIFQAIEAYTELK